jgi:hypothetical protein
MENKDINDQFLNKIEKLSQRLINSKRLTTDEFIVLAKFGLNTGIIFIDNILSAIEEKGLKPAGKKFSGDMIDLMINSINSEFIFRTSHFYSNGNGLQIPIELGLAHLKVIRVIQDLDIEMLYGNDTLSQEINQRELAYLFSALSYAEIFHSSSNLLANSLAQITNYSEMSLRRVMLDYKKTNGGWSNDEKEKLLKKISDIIYSF